MGDLISREMALEHLRKRLFETALNNLGYVTDASEIYEDVANKRIDVWLNEVPSPGVWFVSHTDIHVEDGVKKARVGKYIVYNAEWFKEHFEQERALYGKKGKWEYIQYDGNPKIGNWHCSECRLIVNLGFEGEPYYHYCPGCGAKMKEDT